MDRGQNKKNWDGYKIFYTGKTSGKNGVGVILNETIKAKEVEVIRKSNYIIAIKLLLEASIVNVISVYVQCIRCTNNEKNVI